MKDILIDSTLKSNRLKEAIRESLFNGDFKSGDQLPSEPELIARYGLSRGTVREAIVSLVHEGLLYRIQGKGTFVAERPPYHPMIAVVMPYLFNGDSVNYNPGGDVIPRLMQSIEAEARANGMNIMLYLDNSDPQVEQENIANLLERKVDAVIINFIGEEKDIDRLARVQEAGVPLVMIDRYADGLTLDYVVTDNVAGAAGAVKRLAEAGFENIYYITSPVDNTSLRDRYEGYHQAIKECGLSPNVLLMKYATDPSDSEERRSYRLAKEALDALKASRFAVLTSDAPALAGLWRAIQEADLPHDQFALACFDEPFLLLPRDILFVNVMQPLFDIGRTSVEIIKEKLNARMRANLKTAVRQVKLEPTIHVNGSQ